MNASLWVALAIAIPSFASFMSAPIFWLIRQLNKLNQRIQNVEAQHHRNGGSTVRDAIDRIEQTTARTSTQVTEFGKELNGHLLDAARVQATLETQVAMLLPARPGVPPLAMPVAVPVAAPPPPSPPSP